MKWFRERKINKLKIKLAGRLAALEELKKYGHGNYGIAEDAGRIKEQLRQLGCTEV